MRGIAFTNLVVVPCCVSLLPVSTFGIHYGTPPIETRALKNYNKMKIDKHQTYRRGSPLAGTALFLDKSNSIEMLLRGQLQQQFWTGQYDLTCSPTLELTFRPDGDREVSP